MVQSGSTPMFSRQVTNEGTKEESSSIKDGLPDTAYVDDVCSHTFKDLGRAEKLAAILRISGFLLLGYNGWNIPKAEKDGFYSTLHKFSGVGFNTQEAGQVPCFLHEIE